MMLLLDNSLKRCLECCLENEFSLRVKPQPSSMVVILVFQQLTPLSFSSEVRLIEGPETFLALLGGQHHAASERTGQEVKLENS